MHGIGEAIARNLLEMSLLKVPIITIVIGEGGSGGALALSVSDRLVMLENSCLFRFYLLKDLLLFYGKIKKESVLQRLQANEINS